MQQSIKINIVCFVWYFLTSINLLQTITKIQGKYQCTAFHFYFGIPGYWKRVEYWEDKKSVSQVMKNYPQQTQVDLNFEEIHGFKLNIHHPDLGYHNITKKKLKHTLPSWDTFKYLLIKYQNMLFSPYQLHYNKNLELFVLTVWKDFLVGKSVSINDFQNVYRDIIIYLNKTFHGTKTVFLPGMGKWKR